MLWVGANGSGEEHPPPAPLLSTTNGLTNGDTAAVPLNGLKVASLVALPQASGFAIGASAPPLKCKIRLLNGCSGFSVKVVVSRPVVGFGVTVPFSRTETPYLADSASR